MSFERRLTKIETSLTPKQAVLLWLKEVQPLGRTKCLEKALTTGAIHETPCARISIAAANAVRESLSKQGVKEEVIASAARAARKQADFLFVLLSNLHYSVDILGTINGLRVAFLHEKYSHMLEQYLADRSLDQNDWNRWRANLIDTLAAMWRLRDTASEISTRYYDCHPLLFPENESSLTEDIRLLESLLQHYNSLQGMLPVCTAIDSDALLLSVRKDVPAEVERLAANALSTILFDYGERDEAWKVMQPHVLRARDSLRTKQDRAGKPGGIS